MKRIVVGVGVSSFLITMVFSFFLPGLPPSIHPEPATQRRTTAASAAPEAVASTVETTSIHGRDTTIRVGRLRGQGVQYAEHCGLENHPFHPDPIHPEGVQPRLDEEPMTRLLSVC